MGGGGGGVGVKKDFFPKFNQIWCVSYSHEWHMHRHNFLGPHPLGPWGGVKKFNFADDTSLYLIVDEPCVAATQFSSDLAKIHMWAEKWLVKFNPAKSEAIVISRKTY